MNFADHNNSQYQRMLYEHQKDFETNLGARAPDNVSKHATWINDTLIGPHPKRVLDLGCGIGLYSIALAKYNHSVLGVDISPLVVNHARENCPSDLNCSFIVADMLELDLDEKFDIILFTYSTFNILSPEQRDLFLHKTRSFLSEKGVFYLEVLLNNPLKPGISTSTVSSDLNYLYNDVQHYSCQRIWYENEKKLLINTSSVNVEGVVHQDHIAIYYYSNLDYINIFKNAGFKKTVFAQNPPGTTQNMTMPYQSIILES